ncbi:MAG: sirohydrochlorin cobaltochelatase [Deltaproteobacteria bacterium CG_4_10_14_3_um_filter_60_8]|nr:MAG: hypothetical protein AUK28_00195 [Desulfobacterales bacterium CG2_30_60_27]PIP43563.1 MAG: sirohydrochlorin cobaltochelatase [Deltaproteobacteria bacterium CG23_combo_of_CG06-09_8_20_14_all_60_8]PIY24834.1 MAG: sirohydrochlorin cobaltochelatase [Deltaproteobacteria bacterium CG_4_10_14_3_um_filter_60_8]
MQKKRVLQHVLLILLLILAMPHVGQTKPSEDKAIVLAVFGTSHPDALAGILAIREQVRKAFPKTRVELAFTSNIIRKIWRKRLNDPEYRVQHPEVPPEILQVKGVLAAIANLQDEGFGYILVQPTHIASGEEFADLVAYVDGLNSIKTVKPRNMPFRKIVIGRPALGAPGIDHEYRHDLELAAKALAPDVEEAKRRSAALVYMAHGNEHYSTGYYVEFEEVMRVLYPDTKTYVGVVEGFPALDLVLRDLKHDGVAKVYLKPLMTVAGDHAKNDMTGPEPDAWQNVLTRNGIAVEIDLTGLGENPAFAEIFVTHLREAARDRGLEIE